MNQVPFFGKSLLFRSFRASDHDRILEMAQDRRFYCSFLPPFGTPEEFISLSIHSFLSKAPPPRGPEAYGSPAALALCLRRSGRLIGGALFNQTSEGGKDFDFFINPAYAAFPFPQEAQSEIKRHTKRDELLSLSFSAILKPQEPQKLIPALSISGLPSTLAL